LVKSGKVSKDRNKPGIAIGRYRMIKRIVFIAALVIVLVSLNWFNELFASDLCDLTLQEYGMHLEKPWSGPGGGQRYCSETSSLLELSQRVRPGDRSFEVGS